MRHAVVVCGYKPAASANENLVDAICRTKIWVAVIENLDVLVFSYGVGNCAQVTERHYASIQLYGATAKSSKSPLSFITSMRRAGVVESMKVCP